MSNESQLAQARVEPLTLEQKFTLLADRRRRTLLFILGDVASPVSLTGLSERLLARAEPESATDRPALERVELKLHHVHIPKLAEHDILDYDAESGTVSRGRRFERVHSWLESVDER